ncbi:MAG: photosynthetic reaction center cytochrome c subunit family protein [Acidobacteriota bacterium]|nr:photosynthetic reaction center cytochrome c subunit family protein [Acidobacteriota bacterium]
MKVLTEAELPVGMRQAVAGLGVMCNDCHVPTDRASDEKPMKVAARMMFALVKEINAKFPDGKAHVTCYTCHRGMTTPLMAPPAVQ